MEFKDIVKERYATKKFNNEIIPEDKINELLEIIKLAPSSFGLQPYKIIVISSKELKEKLLSASFNQPQITSCSHLLVFCADSDIKSRIDKYEEMMTNSGVPKEKVEGYIKVMRDFEANFDEPQKISWSQRQAYIALGNAVNGAKSLGFDSCPMEGFNPKEYSKILELQKNIVPAALVSVGYAADEAIPKMRYDDLFIEKN